MKKISKILCCFNSLKTKTIEIYIIILSIIGIILNIIGILVIPWGYTSKAMEIFYIINLVLFFYSFILSIIILITGKKTNRKAIEYCYINSFFINITSILSIFFNIIIAFGTIPDLKNKKAIEYAEIYNNEETELITTNEIKLVSNGKLAISIFLIIINLILWLILLFFWISELIRLKYRINGTYYEYLNDQKNIAIENNKNFEFNVIGHDKYGYPIYGKKESSNLDIIKSSQIKFKPNDKYSSIKYDTEDNNILKYSYKEKYNPNYYKKPGNKSVDIIHKLREEKKEKYIEKYITGAVNPYYSNFDIKSASYPSVNNSINPGK